MDQYITDLARFRDDAHLAAWKPYGTSGHVWEALTLIWREEANTAEALAERLSRRTYTAEDYGQALQDLAARGWVTEEKGAYELTEEGRRVREEAEEATDRHFFVGWSALNEEELTQLEDLLTRAKAGLEAAAQDRVWGLTGEVAQAIPRASWSVVEPALEKHGLEKPGLVFMVLSARRFEPEPTSAARLGLRGPYSNPKAYEGFLAELTETGILSSKGNGDYALTEKGHAALREIDDVFYNRLGELEALPAEPLAQLEGLLNRIVKACLEAEEPENKWAITTTHRGHPEGEYNPLAKIDQRLDDLNGFRDDAHLAAWKPHDVSGPAWEAFTFVWRNEANTAEALAEKLAFRGHSAEAYAEALAELAGRGWVEETSEGYRVTGEGQALRQQVEELTDRYFFAPWTCLSDAETIQLHDLLIRLKISLQDMAGSDEDA
jgi:predicted transcriptional regulator